MNSAPGMRPGDELAGKVALVTGGARNIGRCIALSLAAGGATVMVNANTSRAEGEATVEMIKKAGGKAALHIADVTDPKAVAALVADTVKQFGRIDMVINNAAIRAETPFDKITFDEWKRVTSIVLDGAFLTTQAALPHLIKAGGGAVVAAVSGDGVWTSLILAAVAVVWLGLMLGVRELVKRREAASGAD